jgi:hypothetical protein
MKKTITLGALIFSLFFVLPLLKITGNKFDIFLKIDKAHAEYPGTWTGPAVGGTQGEGGAPEGGGDGSSGGSSDGGVQGDTSGGNGSNGGDGSNGGNGGDGSNGGNGGGGGPC